MPVNTYPELVFEVTNGVPLCGNCHAEVSGNELAYVDRFIELQTSILGIETDETEAQNKLRKAAEEAPQDPKAVAEWLNATRDCSIAIEFFERNRESIKMTGDIAEVMTYIYSAAERHSDAIDLGELALILAKKEGGRAEDISHIGCCLERNIRALKGLSEAHLFMAALVEEYPKNGPLHTCLSQTLCEIAEVKRDHRHPDEPLPRACLEHALKAASLAPHDSTCLSWASFICLEFFMYKDALIYAKRQLSMAKDDEKKIDAMNNIANVYRRNELYGDAIGIYQQIVDMDPDDTLGAGAGAMADIAFCLYMQDRLSAAKAMAKRCLMFDPENKDALSTISYIEKTEKMDY
ncbi:MAG: hypothetical protein JW941_09215 [Candidatus Coatesbacteria bacterium]|nr:hypothetical protein [Candidatus Coatesbacteria bacterium]